MAISKNLNLWCCEADAGQLDNFVLEKILPKTGLLYPLAEISLMALVVDRVKPTHIFEWGTNIGCSAKIFHQITESLGMDIPIHTWDLPEDVSHGQHPGDNHGKLAKGLARVHFHRDDGLRGALAQYQIEKARDPKTRPLFFADGDHSYESVIREITGIVSAHDEFHLLAHDTFVQKPDAKGQSRESWVGCPTALELAAQDYRWLNVGFGNPGMAYLWGRGKALAHSSWRQNWLAQMDRLETRLEKFLYRMMRKLRGN
jgi:hypothetical protein